MKNQTFRRSDLLTNSVPAVDCRWCDEDGAPHSPACPMGERYRQVQDLGARGITLVTERKPGPVSPRSRRRRTSTATDRTTVKGG